MNATATHTDTSSSPDDRVADGERLRLVIVTEDDPLYVIRFFEVFFEEYPRDEFEVVAVTVQNAFHEPISKTARRIWRFYGPIGFVRLGFRFALTKLSRRRIATLAEQADLSLLPTESVNDASYIAEMRRLQPDVIMSVAAPEIFRKDVIGTARLGCVNIHSGRLPKYRGMMPNFWQLLHGEDHATVTVHELVEKLDAGSILGTLEVPIHERDTLDRLIVETKREGARLMIDVLRQIAAGQTQPQPLDMSEAEYFSFPKPDDVRALHRRGHRLL